MGDKEERILIEVLGHRGCPVLSNNNICVLDYDCENCKAGLSHSEVIDKIAKAIEENLNGSSYKSLAEAVLNSLLGV